MVSVRQLQLVLPFVVMAALSLVPRPFVHSTAFSLAFLIPLDLATLCASAYFLSTVWNAPAREELPADELLRREARRDAFARIPRPVKALGLLPVALLLGLPAVRIESGASAEAAYFDWLNRMTPVAMVTSAVFYVWIWARLARTSRQERGQ